MQVRAVELWLRDSEVAAEMGRRLQEAGLTRTWSMLQEHVLQPYARQRRAERITVLTPVHCLAVRHLRLRRTLGRTHPLTNPRTNTSSDEPSDEHIL